MKKDSDGEKTSGGTESCCENTRNENNKELNELTQQELNELKTENPQTNSILKQDDDKQYNPVQNIDSPYIEPKLRSHEGRESLNSLHKLNGQIMEVSSTNAQDISKELSTSKRINCRTLGAACPLRQNTKTASDKTGKNDSAVDEVEQVQENQKDGVAKPTFFHPPKSIFKPTMEVKIAHVNYAVYLCSRSLSSFFLIPSSLFSFFPSLLFSFPSSLFPSGVTKGTIAGLSALCFCALHSSCSFF